MSTRETQNKIIHAALKLFNDSGSRAISTNRIADECGISRGNLHYHFRTKEEIIQTIFQDIDNEMDGSWYEDHKTPTIEHMHFMFERQMRLTWNYRFFFREQTTLIQNDARLKVLVMNSRSKRVKEVRSFFEELERAGYLDFPKDSEPMEPLLLISWLITDQWLPYLDMHDLELNETSIQQGFDLIFQIFLPYFTGKATRDHRRLKNKRDMPAQGLRVVPR